MVHAHNGLFGNKTKALCPLAVTLHLPSLPLETINMLSVSMVLPVLDISYKWNTICSLLYLTSFT